VARREAKVKRGGVRPQFTGADAPEVHGVFGSVDGFHGIVENRLRAPRRRMAWMAHPFSGWGPKRLDDPRPNPAREAEMLGNRGRCVSQNGVPPGFYPEFKDPWYLEGLSLPFHCTFLRVLWIRLILGPIARHRCSEPHDFLQKLGDTPLSKDMIGGCIDPWFLHPSRRGLAGLV